MAKITYPQQLPEDANSIKHVSIGQTRDGKDEWITPVTMWERNKSSGLYLPPGVLSDDDVAIPRVKAQLYGILTELFGESLSDRPPANSVSVGTTFMVVGDTVVYQSNGEDWVVVSE